VDILNKIKGQLEPSFSLWETTICMGFKSYCRSIGTEKGNSFSVALEDIERKAANLKKSIIVASTEGTEPTDVQDREQLKKAIDAFVDGYQMMMI